MSLQLGDSKGARGYFEKSLNLREQLTQQGPDSAQAQRDLAVSYERLGNVSLRGSDLKAAREYFKQYLDLSEQLARQDPQSTQARRDLSVAYERLGNMSLEGGNLKATEDYFEKSLTLREQLAHQEPDNAQARRDLAVLIAVWATWSEGGQPKSGPRLLWKISPHNRTTGPPRSGKRPDQARPRGPYSCLGDVSLRGGDLKAAQDYFKKTLNLSEQLARQDPENAQTGLGLGVSFWKLGHGVRRQNNIPKPMPGFARP